MPTESVAHRVRVMSCSSTHAFCSSSTAGFVLQGAETQRRGFLRWDSWLYVQWALWAEGAGSKTCGSPCLAPQTASSVCRRQQNSLRYSRPGVRGDKSQPQAVCTTAYAYLWGRAASRLKSCPKTQLLKLPSWVLNVYGRTRKWSLGKAASRNLSNELLSGLFRNSVNNFSLSPLRPWSSRV